MNFKSFHHYSMAEAEHKFLDIGGVYGLLNVDSDKIYIGSSENIGKRIRNHRKNLKLNKHNNSKLQKAWNDKSIFAVIIVEITNKWLDKEQELLEKLDKKLLYNGLTLSPEPNLSLKKQKRFWKKVNIGNVDECWEWTGQSGKYGRYEIYNPRRRYVAHRIAYYLSYNEWPNGQLVMHKCNNKKCCNPLHLELGTHGENTRQAVKDGLHYTNPPTGEDHPGTTLSNKQVESIILELINNKTCAYIAKQYNVSPHVIYSIKSYATWKYVGSVTQRNILKDRCKKQNSIKSIVPKIIRDMKDGATIKEISNKYGVSEHVVYNLSKGNTHNDIVSKSDIQTITAVHTEYAQRKHVQKKYQKNIRRRIRKKELLALVPLIQDDIENHMNNNNPISTYKIAEKYSISQSTAYKIYKEYIHIDGLKEKIREISVMLKKNKRRRNKNLPSYMTNEDIARAVGIDVAWVWSVKNGNIHEGMIEEDCVKYNRF